MHAYFAVALALVTPTFAAPHDRLGYEREIDSARYNEVPKMIDYVLTDDYLAAQKNKAKLITKPRPVEAVASDSVILESNEVKILNPRKLVESDGSDVLVRQRRGYNLEHVRVPARYPYLPVPRFNRFRRWGY